MIRRAFIYCLTYITSKLLIRYCIIISHNRNSNLFSIKPAKDQQSIVYTYYFCHICHLNDIDICEILLNIENSESMNYLICYKNKNKYCLFRNFAQ